MSWLTNAQIIQIIGLDSLVNLKTLNLSHNRIRRIGRVLSHMLKYNVMQFLENLESNEALETIDLRANKISQVDDVPKLAEVLAQSKTLFTALC